MIKISLIIVILAVVLAVIVPGALEMRRAATGNLDTWFYTRVLERSNGAIQTTGEIPVQNVEINHPLPDAWFHK